ncbi:DUF3945 domain-containing protein [Parapedobacter sp. 10938]|uniref:DUF3945 domain-containing protein n=1 Tax=Parapedobacter flavus TaxID=3110225 RepID=UPI002DB99C87|nr:DUF3945 domain-containing protein [Parapedobacter sp. 10938]MEC3881819.1 DUF3945 domain-containing protein [Parapedobacter sp. 10938]
MAAHTISTAEKDEKHFASLDNVIGQKKGELFGVKISDIPKKDIYNLERGNFTDNIYELTYSENKKAEGRLKLVADRKTGQVKAEFLMKVNELQKRDWLSGGYKLSDDEKSALYERGEAIVYHNKPIISKRGDEVIRAEKPGEYISKVDPETNQVVTRNLNHPLTFKVPNKLYGAELSDSEKSLLKKGREILIKDPVIRNNEYKGVASIKYDPIRNNIVVTGDAVLKESFSLAKKEQAKNEAATVSQTPTDKTNSAAKAKANTTTKTTGKTKVSAATKATTQKAEKSKKTNASKPKLSM